MDKVLTFTFDVKTGEAKVSSKGFTKETHVKGAQVINKLLDQELVKANNFEHQHAEGFIHQHN